MWHDAPRRDGFRSRLGAFLMKDFITALSSGKVLLMDGAMGTELQRLTQNPSLQDGERLNLTNPDLVRSIHRAYRDVGAEVILTNTFQANPSRHAEQHHAIWNAALASGRAAGSGHYLQIGRASCRAR